MITSHVRKLNPHFEAEARKRGPVLVSIKVNPSKSAPESASILTKFGRLRRELSRWVKSGAKIAPKAIREQRAAICASCEYDNPEGNAGLGECRFPGCGCTRAKRWLATSRCPMTPARWGAVAADPYKRSLGQP